VHNMWSMASGISVQQYMLCGLSFTVLIQCLISGPCSSAAQVFRLGYHCCSPLNPLLASMAVTLYIQVNNLFQAVSQAVFKQLFTSKKLRKQVVTLAKSSKLVFFFLGMLVMSPCPKERTKWSQKKSWAQKNGLLVPSCFHHHSPAPCQTTTTTPTLPPLS
jgi:hypothetical protein